MNFDRGKMAAAAVLAATLLVVGGVTGYGLHRAGTVGQPFVDDGRLKVMASFYPMYDFARKVGGDKIQVKDMVPAGTEPHDWEPAATDIRNLEDADVFVYNGADLEHWAEDVLDTLENQDLVVSEASDGVELLDGGEDHAHGDNGKDPHVWLDPMRAKQEMANIKDAFVKADPENRDYYEANYEKYARSQEQETSLSPDEKTALPENIPPETPKQLVEHPKYGRGTIISENEDTIVIQFDDYGEKEMLKAFSQLKKISCTGRCKLLWPVFLFYRDGLYFDSSEKYFTFFRKWILLDGGMYPRIRRFSQCKSSTFMFL